MPESTLTKARRLPIRILQHDASVTVADVTGDHDTYRVTAVRGVGIGTDGSAAERAGTIGADLAVFSAAEPSVSCTCPAQVEACSHVLRLALWVKEQR